MAEAVVGEFGQVKYYSPWEKAFPSVRDYIPATGLDGIERVYDFWDVLDEADLVVFPDVGNAGLQEWLRRQGKPVFGSGAAARLERDRWYLKSVCKKYELGCAEAMPVTGVENLRNILSEMKDDQLHIKLSTFRGEAETFKHEDPVDTARRLNELALKMEPYGDHAEFVIEQPIQGDPCVEVGADLLVNVGGVMPAENLWGYEVKDVCYGGRVGKLPQRLQECVDKLAPILEQFDYRGPMSTETRETDQGSYFIDFTARYPNPPSALMRFMVHNLGETMWEGAHGRVVESEWLAPIGVQIIFKSEYGKENPLRITSERWDRTVLYGHCQYDGTDYAVSPSKLTECGAAIGMGTTLSQAMEEAVEVAENIKGRDLDINLGALEQLTEAIENGDELGIRWE
jgi:phosphoribosylamine-glycine ligase